MAIITGPQVVTSTLDVALEKLRLSVERSEQYYGCSSAQMLNLVQRGQVEETSDIVKWLTDYHVLTRLREKYGATTGT